MSKLELLAPAGDLEKLKIAIDYGADAVYFAGESFGLRAGARNFTLTDIEEGVSYAHQKGKRVYMTLNIFAHNQDIVALKSYLESIHHISIDAYIVSDPGIFMLVKEAIPNAEIHLSTQANTTNYQSATFWYQQGVKRIVLARELSLQEIQYLRENTPARLELEVFVQGAMCISYSGRCLLSNYMIERDANRGECAHPCRWKYSLVEEKRPGEYFPVEEDERGTYVLNSKDLSMLRHLPNLIDTGINSIKIEGRMKSIFYVAIVVSAYRKAIDAYQADPEHYVFREEWQTELEKASHRKFTTGFYYGKPSEEEQNYQTSSYSREYEFLGLVKAYDTQNRMALIEQRNRILIGDLVEVFGLDMEFYEQRITMMKNIDGEIIEAAPHAQQLVWISMDQPVKEQYMIRKRKEIVEESRNETKESKK